MTTVAALLITAYNVFKQVITTPDLPIDKVIETVRDSFDFKFNCNLVIVDFLVRRGILEGAIEPKAIAKQAKKLDFPAAALVDRNGLYAAMAFTEACQSEGVSQYLPPAFTIRSVKLHK